MKPLEEIKQLNKVPECGECGADMVLRKSPRFPKPFWGCSQFPACRGTHGAHADGRPLGIPADPLTKQWRIKAHYVFDRLWEKKPSQELRLRRHEAYAAVANALEVKEIHIGESDIETCKKIIEISQKILDHRGWN